MLKIYNTLTRSVETFTPQDLNEVTMYSCGPTVYDYQHIGHMRRYVGDDILIKVLKLNGFKINRVMNITDVGHLVSDSDEGEDKMEKGARKFGLTVWEIAKMFEQQFIASCERLLIEKPTHLLHATDYIEIQIKLIEILEEKGFTYRISDGIYFDTSKFPEYTKLSRQNEDALKAGARVEMTEGKKNPTDFALWKFSPSASSGLPNRQMEWESPWGIGFPGWHIECSAMSLEGLFHAFQDGGLVSDKVQTIDIHTGGIDHIAIHHTNEIAQAEAATGKQFVNYWVHHNFLQVEGEKMSKSLGNFYTVQEVLDKGFDPMALRYLYLQTHYRQEMNFTWESLEAAEKGLKRLRGEVSKLSINASVPPRSNYGEGTEFEERFKNAVNDDMNMAKALAVVWELVKSDYADEEKAASLVMMDNVLGLELFKNDKLSITNDEIPEVVAKLVQEREVFRNEKNYKKSDELREEIKKLGYEIKDTSNGTEITPV
jgi:cysteinyl-tRNA synthetase